MSIEVDGGAGGLGATFDDIRTYARILDAAGDGVRMWSDDMALLLVDEAVLGAAVLCPDMVVKAEWAIGAAATGPDGLLPVSVGLEASALILTESVNVYVLFDSAQQTAMEALNVAGAYLLGAALPLVAVGGMLVLASNPLLTAVLYANRDALADGALDTLFENPWLMEDITASLPWIIQGAAGTLTGGSPLVALLSGGHWPTGSYEDSVAGLVSIGSLAGMFADDGTFRTDPVDPDDTDAQYASARARAIAEWVAGGDLSEPPQLPVPPAVPHSVEDIFAQQSSLGVEEAHGQVQIITKTAPDGSTSYIVQVPGTQDWSPDRTDSPVDLASNVNLMSGQDSVLREQIADAMRQAGIQPGDPVMLTGHSQGGIACAAMASDPAFMEEFNVTSIVTGGSPIARFDIPDSVSVLAVEHDQDPVPMLEGRENPDAANWVTVGRDVTDDIGAHTAPGDPLNPGEAHGTGLYSTTGALIDSDTSDPSLAAWREQNGAFLDGGGEVSRYQISPTGPAVAP